ADGIAVLDREGRFRFANDAFARLFDLRRGSELWGKAWRRLQPDGVVQYIEREVLPRLWETGHWRGEVRREDRGGGHCVQELTLAVVGSHSVVVVAREKIEQSSDDGERKALETGVPAR
ncbi:MAG TPA: PAS domain-containing protein, partial [Gemmatimonadaceae bacterium]|nr:PAS domain-containing protein [Gemmatimonadaceae bacterium]